MQPLAHGGGRQDRRIATRTLGAEMMADGKHEGSGGEGVVVPSRAATSSYAMSAHSPAR